MAEKRTTSARAKNTPKSQIKSKGSSGKGQTKKGTGTKQTADNTFSRQVAMIVFFTMGVLFLLVTVIEGSGYWRELHRSIYGLFGFPAALWFVALIAVTVMLSQEKPTKTIVLRCVWMFALLLLISAGITAFSVKNADVLKSSEIIAECRVAGKNGHGAGAFGGATGGIAVKYLGRAGAVIVWLLSVFVFIMITTKTSVAQLIAMLSLPFDKARTRIDDRKEQVNQEKTEKAARSREAETDFAVNGKKRRYKLIEENEKVANMLTDEDDEVYSEKSQRKKGRRSAAESNTYDDSIFDGELNEKFKVLYDAYNDEESDARIVGTEKVKVQSMGSSPDILETHPKNALKTTENEMEEADEISLDELVRRAGAPVADADTSIIKEDKSEKPIPKKQSKTEEIAQQASAVAEEIAQNDAEKNREREKYVFPPIELLKVAKNENIDMTAALRDNAKRLIATLEEYGVKASVSDISRGPTVTRFEIVPAPGVKISKITTLANDIKLRLAAKSVRIEAPIPGKAAVGIEIPNAQRNTVSIRELIDSDTFRNAKGSLSCVLGKDIEGNIITCDLAKMPHLLIAGSTGSGKSVCVNSMLISLMYKYTPEELRMVLVDPKKVEFEVYNGIPHLLVPVVCNPKKAAGVLQWAVVEMEKRYDMLQSKNVRSLNSYNALAEKTGEFEKMSKIVIVIDEMADLMQTTPKEVEDSIARLAAMARAAGMHIILATQRPSVDVITGTIKNNIPSRIALTVSSRIDSTTILGTGGAETLIGYGDMLYNPMGASTPKRVQGCFVSDEEVGDVIGFLKRNGDAEYDESITAEIDRKAAENEKGKGDASSNEGGGFHDEDPTMSKAIEAVIQAGQASVSLLQRKLGVGYARAGKLIDQLEERGIVGPYEGSKPRKVLMTKTQWLEMNMSSAEAQIAESDPAEETLPFDIDDTEE